MNMHIGKLDVLVADDHKLTRTIVTEILFATGCRKLRQVESGEAALEEFLKSPPDIAIVDYHMPSDGLTLLNKVRRGQYAGLDSALPVIVMTGFSDRNRILNLRDAGATEIVTKPLSAKGILSRLAAVIDNPRPFIRSPNFIGPDRRRKTASDYEGPRRRDGETNDVWIVG